MKLRYAGVLSAGESVIRSIPEKTLLIDLVDVETDEKQFFKYMIDNV